MEKEQLVIDLSVERVCKNSVRFDNKNSDILRSIYIMNDGMLQLKNPKKVRVTITSITGD